MSNKMPLTFMLTEDARALRCGIGWNGRSERPISIGARFGGCAHVPLTGGGRHGGAGRDGHKGDGGPVRPENMVGQMRRAVHRSIECLNAKLSKVPRDIRDRRSAWIGTYNAKSATRRPESRVRSLSGMAVLFSDRVWVVWWLVVGSNRSIDAGVQLGLGMPDHGLGPRPSIAGDSCVRYCSRRYSIHPSIHIADASTLIIGN